jgi:hypothetical protein
MRMFSGGMPGTCLPDPFPEHAGKPEEVGADEHHARGVLFEHECANGDLPILLLHRIGSSHSTADRQERIGRHDTNRDARAEGGFGTESDAG